MSSLKNQLLENVESFVENYDKFDQKGNASAGTRARKALQEIRTLAFELRKEISERKKS